MIRRIELLLIALITSLGMVALPAVAQAAPIAVGTVPSPCPAVEFLGMHGVNEGAKAPGMATIGPSRREWWGETLDGVWQKYHSRIPYARADSVSCKRTIVAPVPWQAPWIEPDTDEAANVLETTLLDFRLNCTDTYIVIAGHSQGAWAVDKALRKMSRSPYELNRLALQHVVGVALTGDPARPFQGFDTAGVATRFGRGYLTVPEYLNNGFPTSRFVSYCLGWSDGRHDPVCGAHLSDFDKSFVFANWRRNLPVHGEYIKAGITDTVANFLAAQTPSAR